MFSRPRAFNPESQHFMPLFNKISLLCGQQRGGDEASNEGGATQGQRITLFSDMRIITFFLT